MRIYLKRLQPLRDILELRSTRRRTKDDQHGQASTRYEMRTVFHVNAPLAIVKLLKPVPQSFPQFIQCCRDLYKLLTSSDNMMSLSFSIKRSTQRLLRCCGKTRISFNDWLSGLALFTPSVPSLLLLANDFGDAGLPDVLMESGIVASGSVAGVIEGHHYNCAVCTHKVDSLLVMLDSLYDEVLISTDSNRFYVYFRLCLKHCTDYNGWVSKHGCNDMGTR